MPNNIQNIKRSHQRFHSSAMLQECVDAYFNYIKGDFEMVDIPADKEPKTKPRTEKKWLREAEPPTLSGLAYYLGFKNRKEFEEYEQRGLFRLRLKRARLQIEAAYEKKLHGTNPSGAIFALKNMGWNEKTETLPVFDGTVKIELVVTDAQPASSELTVQL